MATLELLQSKPRTTAELAAHFGVPQRTVQRDLQALREAGKPIEEISSRHYALPASPTRLNPVEALAVHAATRLLHHHAPARNPHYVSALTKLAAMLPEPARSIALESTEELSQRLGGEGRARGCLLEAGVRVSGAGNRRFEASQTPQHPAQRGQYVSIRARGEGLGRG
jgi:predicted DNA-binding transcriptional regulator YafY